MPMEREEEQKLTPPQWRMRHMRHSTLPMPKGRREQGEDTGSNDVGEKDVNQESLEEFTGAGRFGDE